MSVGMLLLTAALASFIGCSIPRIIPVAPPPALHFAKRADTAGQREAFDPLPYRQDLLLIEPKFAPPTVEMADGLPLTPSTEEIAARVGDARIIYRVQVIALRDSASAVDLVSMLRQSVNVGVEVVVKNRLHMVRAGRFDNKYQAHRLKGQITSLGGDFSEAYVVTEIDPGGTPLRDPLDAPLSADTDFAETPLLDEVPESDLPEPELVLMAGWRVLIKSFRDHTEAERFRNLARRKLGRNDIYIILEGPYNKVLVGDYRTDSEARRAADSIRRFYPDAFKFHTKVYLPREN